MMDSLHFLCNGCPIIKSHPSPPCTANVNGITHNVGFIMRILIDKGVSILLSWNCILVHSVNTEESEISNAEVVDCHGLCVSYSDLDVLQDSVHYRGVTASCLAGILDP